MAAILKQESGQSWQKNWVEMCQTCSHTKCHWNRFKIMDAILFEFLNGCHFKTRWRIKLTNEFVWDLSQACLHTKYDWNWFIIMDVILFEFEIFKRPLFWNKMASYDFIICFSAMHREVTNAYINRRTQMSSHLRSPEILKWESKSGSFEL